jgi:hypothetical protein
VPGPLERFLDLAGGPVRGEGVTFSGAGGAVQPVGPVRLWLPLTYRAQLVPSRSFVLLARASFAGLPLRRIAEEYREGRGRYRAGRRVLTGTDIDRSECAELWAWTFALAPRVAFALPQVVAETVDTAEIRALFPYGTETWQAALRFDASSGLLERFATHRQEPNARGTSPWSLEVTAWRRLGDRAFPAELLTRWGERPARRFRLDAVEIGALGRR